MIRIDIRDRRLRGGRLTLSARTRSRAVARKREGFVRLLLDRGETEAIERLRQGDLHFSEVERRVREDRIEELRRPVESLALGSLLDRVVEIVEATQAPGTAKQYRVLRRQLLAEFGRDFDPAALTEEDARRFLHRARPRRGQTTPTPWSPRKQAQVVALAGRAWSHAIRYEVELAKRAGLRPRIEANPWRKVPTPEVRQTRSAFLRPEEWRTLLEAVEGRAVAAALALGCLAGLRLSEVRYLRTDIDVDLDARVLHVQERAGEYPWHPKTRRGQRDLRISDELHRILVAHRATFSGERYFIRTAQHDRPMHSSTLALWTRQAFEAAGIAYGRDGDALTFHSLRHTFVTWLVQRDVQMKKVAILIGDRPEMVDRVYSHHLPSDLDAVVDLVGRVAGGEA